MFKGNPGEGCQGRNAQGLLGKMNTQEINKNMVRDTEGKNTNS